MKNPSLWLLAAVVAVPMAAAAEGSVVGEFDAYTLALSWEPTFCEGKPAAPECASQSSNRFDASNLALHGLWPDRDGNASHVYGYSGADAAEQALDRPATWCRLPEPTLSAETRGALAAAMPGAASCLDRHEWVRHGSCSGLTADAFFSYTAELVRRVAATSFGRYLTAHAGKTVDANEVVAAFEADFGEGGGRKLVLNCTKVRGADALLEAHLRLPKDLGPASELTSMAGETDERGNCPASFLLDPIPTR